jgi:hypothetical protein
MRLMKHQDSANVRQRMCCICGLVVLESFAIRH